MTRTVSSEESACTCAHDVGCHMVKSVMESGWSGVGQVVDQVTQQLYEQTMDTQEGVVYLLLEEMAQQRIKEYLLAYALLLLKGARHQPHANLQ